MTDPDDLEASGTGEEAADTTRLLEAWTAGDDAARERLLDRVYRDLRRLAGAQMAAERLDHTLEPTALVHEVYLRLIDQNRVQWQSRAHFFALAARIMRRVLVDHGRRSSAEKRGGHLIEVPLIEESDGAPARGTSFLELESALAELGERDPVKVRVVEMRFFGGLENGEIAEVLGIPSQEVATHWRLARAWLFRALSRSV